MDFTILCNYCRRLFIVVLYKFQLICWIDEISPKLSDQKLLEFLDIAAYGMQIADTDAIICYTVLTFLTILFTTKYRNIDGVLYRANLRGLYIGLRLASPGFMFLAIHLVCAQRVVFYV